MSREKDSTPITCKICKISLTASGMGSHLYHKHDKMSSEEYSKTFGEFRKKHLTAQKLREGSGIECEICKESQISHKQLLHHIHTHGISWQDYFIKYFFNGTPPTCSCGCGEDVRLIRHGKNEKGEVAYSRTMLAGHHQHRPGYRENSKEQRETMRAAAIKRMQEGRGTWHSSGPSRGEAEVCKMVEGLGFEVEQSNRGILSGLELDIVVESEKVAIEYNGSYWHSDLFKDRKYHLSKQLAAADKGYRLIHIWEADWIQKEAIVRSVIANVLGKTADRIYARKTEVREITYKEANTFLGNNHLQGSGISKIRIGLFTGEELVSVMTFSSLRAATGQVAKKGEYELLRFCNKLNTAVIGGASKLYSYFIKTYTPERIISYANRDWSNGALYSTLGMSELKPTVPGYFYVKSKIRYSRFQFQKHKLVQQGGDPNMSEYEIMLDRGYHRVWDCGNYKYEWTRIENTLKGKTH
jgi:G:T-mismatch repair DNA endonuclease (very short patch repair protein)